MWHLWAHVGSDGRAILGPELRADAIAYGFAELRADAVAYVFADPRADGEADARAVLPAHDASYSLAHREAHADADVQAYG